MVVHIIYISHGQNMIKKIVCLTYNNTVMILYVNIIQFILFNKFLLLMTRLRVL